MSNKQRIAVVGAGIAGLSAAWLLRHTHDVTLFEAADYLGGHTHTVDVELEGLVSPVDTGFLVFNENTYPNLIALFQHLGVASVATDMSFAVSLDQPDLEWSGTSLATVFGQKRNLVNPQFWSMLRDILRFNRESVAWLQLQPDSFGSLRDFLVTGRYSRAFSDWYLLPMAAAIWSCPVGQMLDMPLVSFVRFCKNHGLLQVFNRPQWRTVRGGGREYVQRLAAQLADIRLACPVEAIFPDQRGLRVLHSGGIGSSSGGELFDQVVMACHSDQSLQLLGRTATEAQRKLLASIRYQPNRTVLHTDPALLPRNQKLWSAWNYLAGSDAVAVNAAHQPVSVSYLINRLQPLPFKTPVVVTLNPAREPDPKTVLAVFDYAHPVFDGPAVAAQQQLDSVQGANGIWLAGAWAGHGFHEDGLNSALAVANRMGVFAPWQRGAEVARSWPNVAHAR